jgi:rhodanese-related sulfurtransferase
MFTCIAQAQEWQAGSSDWEKLPTIKRTKLGLYLTPQQAHEMMQKDGKNILFLDIRTRAEAMYVGMPGGVDALVPYVEHQEIMVEWDDRRNIYMLESNIDFTKEVERRQKAKGLNKEATVILICRSGDRSAKASDLLEMHGFKKVFSITEGFEGDMGKEGAQAGRRLLNGWKNAGLPWSYKLDKAKMYFPQ